MTPERPPSVARGVASWGAHWTTLRTKLRANLRGLTSAQDCYLCDGAATAPVCAECVAAFPPLPAARCPCCALPATAAHRCGRCLTQPPHYDTTIAALAYGDPLDHAVQAFKYHHALGLSRFLAGLLDDAVSAAASNADKDAAAKVDLIIPLPLAPARLSERGFDQALELARPIAARRRIALAARAVRRIRNTPPQAQLPWHERARNIKGAFVCDLPLKGLRVAVVDDVMTTGASLDEIARVLKAAGAAHVTNWVVARTLPQAWRA